METAQEWAAKLPEGLGFADGVWDHTTMKALIVLNKFRPHDRGAGALDNVRAELEEEWKTSMESVQAWEEQAKNSSAEVAAALKEEVGRCVRRLEEVGYKLQSLAAYKAYERFLDLSRVMRIEQALGTEATEEVFSDAEDSGVAKAGIINDEAIHDDEKSELLVKNGEVAEEGDAIPEEAKLDEKGVVAEDLGA